jgi:hypothetical protein
VVFEGDGAVNTSSQLLRPGVNVLGSLSAAVLLVHDAGNILLPPQINAGLAGDLSDLHGHVEISLSLTHDSTGEVSKEKVIDWLGHVVP